MWRWDFDQLIEELFELVANEFLPETWAVSGRQSNNIEGGSGTELARSTYRAWELTR
jgi:hypothetical protein